MRTGKTAIRCLTVLTLLLRPGDSTSADNVEELLPPTTCAFIAVDHAERLEAAWQQTQWGILADSEAMKPFVSEADRFFKQSILPEFESVAGTSIDALRKVASGEMAGALVPSQSQENHAESLIVIDVQGNVPATEELLKVIADNFARRDAVPRIVQREAAKIQTWEWKSESNETRTSCWLLNDGRLLFSTSLAEIDDALARWKTQESSLSSYEAFQKSMAACQLPDAGSPSLRWFVDPVSLLQATHKPGPFDEPEDHPAAFARRHGMDATKAIAGRVTGRLDTVDLLVRVAIIAPKPHRGAMAIFDFPSDRDTSPDDRVDDTVNMTTVLNFNLPNAFDHLGGLFDDLYADGIEGTFNDIINDLKADDGPQVDLRKDLLEHLSSKVTIANDSVQPISGRNERSMFSIDISGDEDNVTEAVKKLLRDDPGVRRYRVPSQSSDLWTIGESAEVDEENGAPKFRTLAVMVAEGKLMIATNADAIRKVLANGKRSALNVSPEHLQVMSAIAKLTPQRLIGRAMSHMGRDIETTYELIRLGRTDEVESVYGIIAGMFLKRFRDPGTEEFQVDFTKLPEFNSIRQYFGLAGLVGENIDDGWRITAFTLSNKHSTAKEVPQ